MSFYSVQQPLHEFEAPYTPLVEAHAAYGRIAKLTGLLPEIIDTKDINALAAASELAADNAHHVRYMANRADELAQRPGAQEMSKDVPVFTNTSRRLAQAEFQKFQGMMPDPDWSVPHRQVMRSAADALRSATDEAAVEQMLALVRNYPDNFLLCAAAVQLGQRIRDDNALRHQDSEPHGQYCYRGPSRETVSKMARHGSRVCKALEATMVGIHNQNLKFMPSPEVERVRTTAEYARQMPVTPTQYYQGVATNEQTTTHIVVFEHWGTKYAKAIWEPYPPAFPSHLAIEHMNSAVASTAISKPEDGYEGSTATAVAVAAVMELHNTPAKQLNQLLDAAGPEGANALLILAAGNQAVASLLARQAGNPTMQFPDEPPKPGSTRHQRAAAAAERTIGTLAVMRAKARMGQTREE